jgi:hypothetical protein
MPWHLFTHAHKKSYTHEQVAHAGSQRYKVTNSQLTHGTSATTVTAHTHTLARPHADTRDLKVSLFSAMAMQQYGIKKITDHTSPPHLIRINDKFEFLKRCAKINFAYGSTFSVTLVHRSSRVNPTFSDNLRVAPKK